ncbi:ABC transporter substrate-binding protein [Desulfotignum phosphitoxidans]|uniref:ABC-type cobalamin/Fe3+-siderophore transport system periplasmic substrate-binding protein n=1 Tax=Desulfotignum phosphitoxidans DSM 13687 TaxID=1286635 RepID=S0FS76_9BACT|nr:ABC transporter substrate-binding protein [Desulfotignum phosphitoxidans]EMS77933.1 ABC-type cobalamin/Fe3+-siderophore transport system periplasmic substrate-binding protein [Desulfotignum phosphitoxidans DSM 13687]
MTCQARIRPLRHPHAIHPPGIHPPAIRLAAAAPGVVRRRFPVWTPAVCLVAILTACLFLPVLLPACASAGPIEVTDAAGILVTLDQPAARVVVIGAAPFIPLHMFYMFDQATDQLAGFEVRGQVTDEFLELIDPDLSMKQTLAANPGPESVAALAPDLVITKSTVEGQAVRTLKALGIPVMHVGAETPDMFLSDIQNLGKVLGQERRADIIVQFYTDHLAQIQQAVSPVPDPSRPRVLVLEYSSRGNRQALNVPAPGWIQTQQAVICGGNPVWTGSVSVQDGWQITGFEQIAAWDPDKIFLIVWYQLKGIEVLDSLYQDPKWASLSAVKQHELHLFPQDIFGWDSASPRWILGALWMAKKTYPDRFTDLDMSRTVTAFYTQMYGLDPETIATRLMPDTLR